MRPTRWTRQRRRTKQGKGGWNIGLGHISYTHPVTGDGVSADSPLRWRWVLVTRSRQEQERREQRAERERWLGVGEGPK